VSGRFLIAAVLPFALPTAAVAQETSEPEPGGRESGVYLRAGGGVAFGGSFDQDLSFNPAIIPPTPFPTRKSTDLASGATFSAAIGFQYPGRTRTELEYRRMMVAVDSVAFAGGTAPSALIGTDDKLTADALMSNVYVDLAPKGQLNPYIGVGVGGARITNELGERDAAFAYQGRVGIELALGGKAALGVEYAYLRTTDVVYGPEDFSGGGFVRADGAPFVSSSIMASLRVVF
jgi:opacity protein-like surface antigen